MSPLYLVGYVCALFVGIVLGLLGGGGSILSIPILVYLFGLEPVIASAYSLFIVGITSFVGAIPKYREHLVNLKTAIVFGVPSILAIFGTRKWIVPALPEIILDQPFYITKRLLLLGVFAILMVLASIAMIRKRQDSVEEPTRYRTFLVMVEGLLIGALTGFVGAGGGFLIIPALVLLTGLPFKTAVGTSLFIIAANSLLGFAGDVLNYSIDWSFLLSITAVAVVGIFIGSALNRKVNSTLLRRFFGWFTLAMGIFILFRELS
jgi:uncharacterized protein